METTDKIWFNGKLVPWSEAKVHVINHTMHYGTGAFEGMRFYDTKKGPAIFQLDRHIDRWLYSAKCLHMKVPYSKAELRQATIETVKVNKIKEGYIRPIAYYDHGPLRVNPVDLPVGVAIACWPWGSYLGEESARLKVSSYIRIHPQTTYTDAKITGHYVNAMLAVREATEAGYTEALMLDYEGYVAEGSAENIFIIKDGIIYTPPLGTILAGITRESVITLAKDLGYKVVEKKLKIKDILEANECFLTGTAAEVSPVGQIDKQKLQNQLGPVTAKLKKRFEQVICAEDEKYYKWLTFVK
ncbi:MAG: branched-chain amino acid transaminase [Parcubacteria group bacterium]|nr:branched-chain amino acid transaminase [Parcubacteria group bacterium]